MSGWSITTDKADIPEGAISEGLRDHGDDVVAWRWYMPERVKPETYVASGIVGQSLFPAMVGDHKHLPYRITFPTLGGMLLPGVYTSEAGHSVVVEGP